MATALVKFLGLSAEACGALVLFPEASAVHARKLFDEREERDRADRAYNAADAAIAAAPAPAHPDVAAT